jgi:hypothetical protein
VVVVKAEKDVMAIDGQNARTSAASSSKVRSSTSSDVEGVRRTGTARKREGSEAAGNPATKRPRVHFDGVVIEKGKGTPPAVEKLVKAQAEFVKRMEELAEHDRELAAYYNERAEIVTRAKLAGVAFGQAAGKFA